ncbi:MAG: response regulator transcription factor [Ardenticatenaceae bacterium]|nr:response regulator transcription factor [Anaerolineales bacterium]MCB8982632.1 response regulator transcription factor [Ardenticatenaceae bacterium]
MSDLIRILIADDHPIVRQGLTTILVPRNGVEVIGEAENGRQAIAMAHELAPDVILMDMVMPDISGLDAATEILKENANARILILTSFGVKDSFVAAIQAGVMGYLLKDSQPADLFQAIHSVYRGQLTFPPHLALALVDAAKQPPVLETNLTEREQQVLEAVAEGLTNQEIAQRLMIGVNTVRTHISTILRKLGLSNRTQLAVYMLDRRERP